MATPDVSKESIYDPRIVQTPARYAVAKGGVSVTNANFLAVAQTTSQHTYNINSPSLQTFIDRAINWTSTVYLQFLVAVNTPQPAGTILEPIIVYGRDFALSAFPLQQCVGTLTAQINDTTVSINTDTVLKEVLRLTDYKANRLVRTCPTKLDTYASYNDAYLAINNPLASYLDATENGETPNGAYWDVAFTNPAGTDLSTLPTGTYLNNISGSGAGVVQFQNTATLRGIPVRTNASVGAENGPYSIYFRFTSKEKLVLSPFIFADSHEYSTGLFSVNNIQLVMTISPVGVSRVLRSSSGGGRVISTTSAGQVQFNTSAPNGGFNNSQISLMFISPNLDLPLPSKSVIPYTDFPRYITTGLSAIPANSSQSNVSSQTITLPSIPDLLVIYAKPSAYADTTTADFYLPITQISLNFNNYAGLLSNHTTEQLYQMAVSNGLEMDYNEWVGSSWTARTGSTLQTVGGFLVIKPGKDFALQTGEAPGLQGQITVQYNVTIRNPSNTTAFTPVLYLITVRSGFFETLAGSSRTVLNVLSEADVINAPMAPEASSTPLTRIVGGAFWSNLGSMLSKAQQLYTATKPAVSAVKGLLPDTGKLGAVKQGLATVGYGAPAGAGRTGGKKKLMERLM